MEDSTLNNQSQPTSKHTLRICVAMTDPKPPCSIVGPLLPYKQEDKRKSKHLINQTLICFRKVSIFNQNLQKRKMTFYESIKLGTIQDWLLRDVLSPNTLVKDHSLLLNERSNLSDAIYYTLN